ncbi:hypothetical protein WR25_19449 [Diploscapter pachys]|uniref:L-2-hydroxyglutarate dehydrogenase, mitochondrial n=1 Tax=Diploscapter pachys TaxID=2018661 RepID=A0A2A2JWP3_9BILA|nr:hypothetical protein WR25_19449 [Diploscapter pachys]
MNFDRLFKQTHSKIPIKRWISRPPAGNSTPLDFDAVIVGGGIVGCATARQLLIQKPNLKIAIIEKEDKLGLDLSYKFFDENKIPYKKTGKLIVAVEPVEVERLENLFKRAQQNGCRDIEVIDGSKIKDYEPHCKGLKALWSPHTGIVDWGFVTTKFAEDFENRGGKVFVNYPFVKVASNSDLERPIRIFSGPGNARNPDPKIVPFRGEYLLLRPEKRHLVRGNIYPVPDPRFPFLGVHFTPRMNGDVWLGPNAVLAYKREGYSYFDISPTDLMESLSYSGMRKLMGKYFSFGVQEFYRGVWIAAQVKQLQRFVPELKFSDVTRGPAGVRAQAMDANGNLVDDFVFDSGKGELSSNILNVRNAPSPAATSSLAIAEMIVEEVINRFKL